MSVQGYVRLMISTEHAFQLQRGGQGGGSAHTLTPTQRFYASHNPKSHLGDVWDVCVCACVRVRVGVWVRACVSTRAACVHIPQKDFKTRKKEKHATKIPSSRGLFIEDSSCFFVSGPRVKKKRGEKEKRENSKKITGKNGWKKEKNVKKRKEERAKRTNQQEFMVAYVFFVVLFFSFKKSTKAKTKGITDTDLSQEKTQDQRNLDFWTWFPFSPPAEENGCHCFLRSPCSLFSLLKTPQCSLRWHFFFFFSFSVFWGKSGWWV